MNNQSLKQQQAIANLFTDSQNTLYIWNGKNPEEQWVSLEPHKLELKKLSGQKFRTTSYSERNTKKINIKRQIQGKKFFHQSKNCDKFIKKGQSQKHKSFRMSIRNLSNQSGTSNSNSLILKKNSQKKKNEASKFHKLQLKLSQISQNNSITEMNQQKRTKDVKQIYQGIQKQNELKKPISYSRYLKQRKIQFKIINKDELLKYFDKGIDKFHQFF